MVRDPVGEYSMYWLRVSLPYEQTKLTTQRLLTPAQRGSERAIILYQKHSVEGESVTANPTETLSTAAHRVQAQCNARIEHVSTNAATLALPRAVSDEEVHKLLGNNVSIAPSLLNPSNQRILQAACDSVNDEALVRMHGAKHANNRVSEAQLIAGVDRSVACLLQEQRLKSKSCRH